MPNEASERKNESPISPESLRILAAANAELSTFLTTTSQHLSAHAGPDEVLSSIEIQLPTIAATLERAGRAIGPSAHSEYLNQEAKTQVDFYIYNLGKLKTLLAPLLASAQERRRYLAVRTAKAREAQSWLDSLKVTRGE